ncbi:MAG: GDSL-type esterase/lipase family protein [Candidatus Methylacidiphilales bacterium]
MKYPLALPALYLAAHLLAPVSLTAQSTGPTPFPDAADSSSWPGKGPTKVYPYMTDNRKYFWDKRSDSQGAVVFVGDSLIGNWAQAKVPTNKAFPQLKLVVNRGIGGDTSRGVLFRFQEDVLDLHPTAIVILVGTNDLSAHGKPEDTISNLTELIDAARKATPGIPLVLCTIPPRDVPKAPIDHSKLVELNERIATLGKEKENVAVLDLFSLLANSDGKPTPEFFRADQIHLSDAGYEKFAEAISKIFEQQKVK